MREKERIVGIWMNAETSDFRSAPSFFAVSASRPINEIVDDRTAAIYELGTDFIQLSPSGQIDPIQQIKDESRQVDDTVDQVEHATVVVAENKKKSNEVGKGYGAAAGRQEIMQDSALTRQWFPGY